jgi:hypothetical protein
MCLRLFLDMLISPTSTTMLLYNQLYYSELINHVSWILLSMSIFIPLGVTLL